MRVLLLVLAFTYPSCVAAQGRGAPDGRSGTIQPEAWQIVQLANQARAAAGAGPLTWDPALSAAARQHCLRMAAEGPISHRYGGEPDLDQRAGQAGAHFSLIEENVAVGPTPARIHEEWMNSPDHRANLLNPKVDHVGVAVVSSRGVLYAVADFERSVPILTQTQVEASIAQLLRGLGATLRNDPTAARAYCTMGKAEENSSHAGFRMLWQEADLTILPRQLVDKLASGEYKQAAVGSCPAQGVEGAFTAYRIAVLLY
ncbi:MAG: CAP domain-containing protein [Terracidiphilus sp.]